MELSRETVEKGDIFRKKLACSVVENEVLNRRKAAGSEGAVREVDINYAQKVE